jgi:aldehyde dehydrogenase (NAD+)
VTANLQPHFGRPPAFDELERIYEAQQQHRRRVGATTAAQRIEKIGRLKDALFSHRQEIRKALWDDYRKPAAEVDLSEIYPVVGEAKHAMRRLRKWMKPRRVSAPLALLGSRSRIVYEPKGVVLIISPWNFPFNLTLGPLVSALAAGNCAVIKPSEMTPNASACMKRILASLFDESEVAVIEGDAAVAEELLARAWDHIFFTGSPRVGKLVMKAAAEHLTSVTLELGGKSPVIVDRTADLDEAAKKIAWGKAFNSGQICIAPDYVLVDESVQAPFLEKLRASFDALGGPEERGWLVNDGHVTRIRKLFDEAVAGGAKVVTGGVFSDRAVSPTVLADVPADSGLLREEIFGPLLPVLTYRNIEEALAMIAERDRPLVLYIFSRSRQVIRDLMRGTRAGGTAVNETLLHFYQLNLPFGGIGPSGVGKGHGQFGFEAFSNARGVLEQPFRFATMQLLYPPYTSFKQKLIDLTVRWF